MKNTGTTRFYESKEKEAFSRCMEEYGEAMFAWNLAMDSARKCVLCKLATSHLKAEGDKEEKNRIDALIQRYKNTRSDPMIILGLKRYCNDDIMGPWYEGRDESSHNPIEFRYARNLLAHKILELFHVIHLEKYGEYNPYYAGIDVVNRVCEVITSFRKEVNRRKNKLDKLMEKLRKEYENEQMRVADTNR